MDMPQTMMPPSAPPAADGAEQATIAWAGGQVTVDAGQGPQPVADIGAALKMVLDAYRASGSGAESVGFDSVQDPARPSARPAPRGYGR